MKLLFIDHIYHRRTHSADFLLELLRESFDVSEHWYERFYQTNAAAAMATRDMAVIYEFPISRSCFYFSGKRNVFVPMYDNEWGSYWQWKRIAWSGMGVISFCTKVSEHARRCGVRNLLEVRYSPDPSAFQQDPGDPKKVFLWERGGISHAMAEKMFPPAAGYSLFVKGAADFWPRAEYFKKLAACGIVVAPRLKEGIGMAFLEAMAMGKCVAANNDATMNEYIRDGENGILFDADDPHPLSLDAVLRARQNARKSVEAYFELWKQDERRIIDFISAQRPCKPPLLNRVRIALTYPLFMLEGVLYRLRQRMT